MKKLVIIFLSFILLTFIIYFNKKLILSEYAKFFTINNATSGADAIMILSGGRITRIPHALKLFQKGYAPFLLITEEKKSDTFFSNLFPTNLVVANSIMKKLNISAPIISIPSIKGGATSTFDEAYDLKKYIENKSFLKIILVTDSFHTRRALHAFEKVFVNENINFQMSAAKNDIFNEENWWTSDQGISAYVLESIKYPLYLFSTKNLDYISNN